MRMFFNPLLCSLGLVALIIGLCVSFSASSTLLTCHQGATFPTLSPTNKKKNLKNVKRKSISFDQINVTPYITKSIEFAEFSFVVVPVATNPNLSTYSKPNLNPNPNPNHHYSVAAVIILNAFVKYGMSFHILA